MGKKGGFGKMADSGERDDHRGDDSDDEIARLREKALLTKKLNEAEISPSHTYSPSSTNSDINKPLPDDRYPEHNNRNRNNRRGNDNRRGFNRNPRGNAHYGNFSRNNISG